MLGHAGVNSTAESRTYRYVYTCLVTASGFVIVDRLRDDQPGIVSGVHTRMNDTSPGRHTPFHDQDEFDRRCGKDEAPNQITALQEGDKHDTYNACSDSHFDASCDAHHDPNFPAGALGCHQHQLVIIGFTHGPVVAPVHTDGAVSHLTKIRGITDSTMTHNSPTIHPRGSQFHARHEPPRGVLHCTLHCTVSRCCA